MQRRHNLTNDENVLRLSRTSSAQTPGTAKSTSSPMGTHSEHDDEEDFSRFFGRERMDNQSFTPRPKAAPKKVTDPLAIPDDDELEAMEDDDFEKPAPVRKLPNKFLDPSEDVPSLQNQKQPKQSTNPSSTSPTQSQELPKNFVDPLADPDDPFANVFGRGEMTDQSYVPHASKALPKSSPIPPPTPSLIPIPPVRGHSPNKPPIPKPRGPHPRRPNPPLSAPTLKVSTPMATSSHRNTPGAKLHSSALKASGSSPSHPSAS